ncbi:MAG: NAD(P)/FAD-dependent oxidoreductase [Candidatus Parvarchaeota archaeon]|nr:NAD(P)/FAD-dependent oxidoreductase [Candidatus Jingweiarchaeum tengchongense]MCW1297758.1 NAD(P)/FAD-dependent oxidoreductase [Candidatus Jingweiarchaeum tengchongense]MCW1299768.1 NAD(P)/FAD-dependent oxidoreductase [Candidatus Jingweiarchaeum tengchongense]MCW1304261.1 NAD(P)/FAD-dependent oxidoreductase [Candidatus Jingweiarchaeum tengchongense]MCW1305289.1 NAD(P)/FAD-dependent oxidoreductase [Candidatus Jingweiarchaeum tengchongense]
MENKVIIVGAGIIGNFLAYELSKNGIECLVIEKKSKFGKEACTSLVSKRIFDFAPKKFIINKIDGARIFFHDKQLEVIANEKAYVIDRKALEEFYAKNAELACYKMNEKFKDFYYCMDGINAITERKRYFTNLLVGCDGAASIISRKIGNKWNFITGIQTRAKIKRDKDFVEIYFGEFSKDFFAWVVPENDEIARIGLASSSNVYDYFKKFLKFLDVKEGKVDVGLIPISLPKKTCSKNLIIVGDAASQVKASTGGGIITGMHCAKHAINAIKNALKEKDFSEEFFVNEYETKWKSELMWNFKTCYFIRKTLENFSDKDYQRLYEFLSKKEIMNKVRVGADMDFYSNFVFSLFSTELLIFILKQLMHNPKIIKNISILI